MSISQRGSVKWCEFEVGGIRHRESCNTNDRREADAYERSRKTEEKLAFQADPDSYRAKFLKTGVQAADTMTPQTLTIEIAFARYAAAHKHRKDYEQLVFDLTRIEAYLATIQLPKTEMLKKLGDYHMEKLIAWRKAHTVGQFRTHNKPKNDKLVANGTVNRSINDRLVGVFNYAREIILKGQSQPFPLEPTWALYIQNEDGERVRILTPDEQLVLIDEMGPDYDRFRRFAIVSGMRLDNCILKKSSVNWETMSITVRGKGDKLIHHPITDLMADIIREGWDDHPDWVFTYLCERGRAGHKTGIRYPITYSGLQSHWNRARKRAAKRCPSLLTDTGGVMNFRFHDHRHVFATNLQMSSGDIRLTQGALKHASVTQTEKYAHIVNTQLRAAMGRAETNHYLPGITGTPKRLPPPQKEDAA